MKPMVRGVIALLSAVAIVSDAAAPAARAAYPGNNGLLLFEGWGAGGWSTFDSAAPAYDLWTVAEDGSGLTNITNSLGVDADAQWSPDGKRITFISNRSGNYDIYVMNPDGSGVKRLTSSPADEEYPTWSPNGRRIAYISQRARQPQIIVMRSDGTRKRSLGSFRAYIWHLAWSPDAPKIVFVRESIGEGYWATNDDEDIHVVNVRTKRVKVLANEVAPEYDPVWSPDGRSIAYARDYCPRVLGCRNSEIFTMRPDGSKQRRITRTPHSEYDPAWSPDGTKIAYAFYEVGPFGYYVSDIDLFVMNADGTDQRPVLTKPDTLDYQVDWQPLP